MRELEDLEQVFDALAHATRRHILLVIRFRGGAVPAGTIAARFSHTWPTTTRHLRVLENAGLVRVERQGRERIYSVVTERLRDVAGRWLAWFDDEDDDGDDGDRKAVRRDARAGRAASPRPRKPTAPGPRSRRRAGKGDRR